MGAQVSNSTVTGSTTFRGGDAVQGGPVVDSIHIDSVRVLLSRLKFKRTDEDTNSGGRDVKTGPAVLGFKDGKITAVFKSAIPVGIYDRVKLEKHKFSSSEVDQYKNDPVFGDFAYPEKLTLIIDGTAFVDGEEKAFTLTDDATENFWIGFEPAIEVKEDQTTTVDILFDGNEAFLDNGTCLDPWNDNGRREISKNLKKAFRLKKRFN